MPWIRNPGPHPGVHNPETGRPGVLPVMPGGIRHAGFGLRPRRSPASWALLYLSRRTLSNRCGTGPGPSRRGPELTDGLYMLTEFQPMYDFETDEFDLWMGPEFGKILSEGRILYIKPGWGFDVDPVDRKFTLEVGYRYFF